MTIATTAPPDRAALARLVASVSARLSRDPAVYKVPGEAAELYAIQDFLSAEECDRFIALVDKVAQPSATFDPAHQAQYRTSYSGDVDPADPFVRMIERRIDDLLGIDPSFGETVQGQRYHPGQQFQAHHDWFHTDQPYWPAEVKAGGQRGYTAMIYLNDVEEGGVTAFPHLGVRVSPARGMLLVWANACSDGTVNPATLHAAEPVVHGAKYVITKWYRSRKWTPPKG